MSDSEERLDMMFAAIRALQPDISPLERSFESRLMANIREKRESRLSWFSGVWRFVPVFMILTFLIGFTDLFIRAESSQDLLTAITSGYEESLVKTYLTGE